MMNETPNRANNNLNEFIYNHNTYLHHYISLADSKALVIITLNSVIGTFIYKNLVNSTFEIQDRTLCILLISGILLLVSYIFSLSVVFPRTSNKNGNGIIFWEDIITTSKEDYLNKVVNTPSILDSMIEQNYYLAKKKKKKYQYLRTCFIVSFTSYAFLALYGAITIFN